MSIRDHRTRSAYATHGRAELKGKDAASRAEWLARKTAQAKKRATRAEAARDGGGRKLGDDKE